MTDPKPKTAKVPRYKTASGEYLAVVDGRSGWEISWWIPQEADFGSSIVLQASATDDPDMIVAQEACLRFCREHKLPLPSRDHAAIEFDSKKDADACLKAINAALYFWKNNIPLPEWAQQALSQGWTPPKGWRPPAPTPTKTGAADGPR